MVRFFRSNFLCLPRRKLAAVLAFVLCCGFLIGVFCAAGSVGCLDTLISVAARQQPSLAGLFMVVLLPLFASLIVAYAHQLWALIPISFLEAFSGGYLGAQVLRIYGASGWLVRLLLLFSDCIALPVLCWFWMRVADSGTTNLRRNFLAAFSILSGIVLLDCQFISPFLVRLLS